MCSLINSVFSNLNANIYLPVTSHELHYTAAIKYDSFQFSVRIVKTAEHAQDVSCDE